MSDITKRVSYELERGEKNEFTTKRTAAPATARVPPGVSSRVMWGNAHVMDECFFFII